jgi:hypothetical protein
VSLSAAAVVILAVGVGAALANREPATVSGPATTAPSATSAPVPSPSSDPTSTPALEEEDEDDAPATPYEPVTEPAVPLDQPVDFGTGVSARLVSIEPVDGVAEGPGEVSGPSLQVTVELTNATATSVSLDTTVVDLYAGPDAVPGELLAGAEDTLFSGEMAPGTSATAVYVFRVAPELRSRIQVTVSYTPGAPTVLFEGPMPGS